MAVLPMAKINIYGLKSDRKGILEHIQHMGIVDIRNFLSDADDFEKTDMSQSRARLSKTRSDIESALEVINKYSPKKKPMFSFLSGNERLDKKAWDNAVKLKEVTLSVAQKILELEKESIELSSEIVSIKNNIETIKQWENIDFPLSLNGTKKTSAFIGTFPDKKHIGELEKNFNELASEQMKEQIYIEIINSSEAFTNAFVICRKEFRAEFELILKKMGFVNAPPICDCVPSDKISELEKRIKDAKNKIQQNEEELFKLAKKRKNLEIMFDYFSARISKYETIEKLGQSKKTFVLTGFVPLRDVEKLEKNIVENFSAAFEWVQAQGEDVPVLLENGAFSAPLEGVLETFSLPGHGEVDPTSIMAVFYYFLFGLMLSDAAYGILMVLICFIALKFFLTMKTGMKKALKMYFYCGISTTFWGIMFGGYFGDAIQVISKTFFNKEVFIKPLWFSPINEPMKMLMFSFAVGIVHLFAGLGMRFYLLVKQKRYKDAIYDVVFWYLLVGGAIVFLMSTQMFIDIAGLGFTLPQIAGKTAAIIAIVGAIGIVLTGGRSSKNPFKKLAKGLYELYNVTGYLSDILSYSRLLALGLATGVIANVFNKMGSMLGGGVFGAIGFTIIFLIGHTLNIGINLLGAYVHTNRLQFVEFFGKFYEGGGVKYSPLKISTEHFEIKNNE